MNRDKNDLIIVGAGLCGLMAATVLANQANRITLLDKGHSVGGRLATRRLGPGRADHGAQFFTVRDARFDVYVKQWQADGLVFQWSTGWSAGSGDSAPPDGYPRYAVSGGMNMLAKGLASSLSKQNGVMIETDAQVTEVAVVEEGWRVSVADGRIIQGDALLLTAPVPQSLALLDAGQVVLESKEQARLEAVAYAPCLCAMVWVDGAVNLPQPGAIQEPDAPFSWIADNRAKGISPEATVVTLHAGPELSRARYDEGDDTLRLSFVEALSPYLSPTATIRQVDIKRWRYALPTLLYSERFCRASALPPLYFAGDAFGGPRIEGAALSGIEAGKALLEQLHGR